MNQPINKDHPTAKTIFLFIFSSSFLGGGGGGLGSIKKICSTVFASLWNLLTHSAVRSRHHCILLEAQQYRVTTVVVE